jgi:hypothetical protein
MRGNVGDWLTIGFFMSILYPYRDNLTTNRLHKKHPGAIIYTLRIGYNAVFALGGVVERVAPR